MICVRGMERVVLLLAFFIYTCSCTESAGCVVNINKDLGKPQTLILQPGNHSNYIEAFHFPSNSDGDIIFAEDEEAVVACPGGVLKVEGSSINKESAVARCKAGLFVINNERVKMKSIRCTVLPVHTARYTGEKCLGDNKEIEIGFKFEDGRFLRHIEVCFDPKLQGVLYSGCVVSRHIDGFQVGFARPNFVQDNFYDIKKVDKMYTRKNQRRTVNGLLGLDLASTKYIGATNDLFLSRGHMVGKADFPYGSQQRLTFHLVNAAPQWQTMNGANWNTLEQDVRNLAANRSEDLVVVSGAHGVTTLPHEETGEDIELYLYAKGNKRAIPVPELYWKVVYEPLSKSGVAFVGVNNPYWKNVKPLCESICEQVEWLRWDDKDLKNGHIYCCKVADLSAAVGNIPPFDVVNSLT